MPGRTAAWHPPIYGLFIFRIFERFLDFQNLILILFLPSLPRKAPPSYRRGLPIYLPHLYMQAT